MGKQDAILAELDAAAPALRRYARALCVGAPPAFADDAALDALQRVAERIRNSEERPVDAAAVRRLAYAETTRTATRKLRANPAARIGLSSVPVLRGLAELPAEERAVLLLVTLEGLGYDEAAATLGVARETAIARLMRARAALGALESRPAAHLRVVK